MGQTAVGFQGTISDTQMATQLGGHHAPTVRGPGDCLVTAVAGARTVNVAAGIADSGFVKVTTDGAAAGNIALAPPNAGGKWYAVTIDRQWSPTSIATVKGDDLNVSDANGTIPTTIPQAVLTALAALPNAPGTAGSTAGQRQVLGVVYVRAADTTLTLFDLRLIRTGLGPLTAMSVASLLAAAQCGHIRPTPTTTVAVLGDGITYQWDGAVWNRWESAWSTYLPGYQNINLSFSVAQFRYRAGRVLIRMAGTVTGTGDGTFLLALPVNGGGSLITGTATLNRNGSVYRFAPGLYTANLAQFFYGAPESPITGKTPAVWANGDAFSALFEYDPA